MNMQESNEFIEQVGQMHVQWKIKKFSVLSTEEDYSLHSPRFLMCNAKWYIKVFTNGETMWNTLGWIGLYLVKEASAAEQRVAFRLEIKRTDGTAIKACDIEKTFKKNGHGWGEPKVIKRSELLSSKDVVVPDDVLTVVCFARIVDEPFVSPSAEAASHTSLAKKETTEAESQTTDGIPTLIQNLKDLYFSKRITDVTITVKDREFLAHRSILSARSTVLSSMFNNDMTEKNTGRVEITDCDPDSFEDFLVFLYTGNLNAVCINNAINLYKISDKYNLKELKDQCIRCMINEMTIDSVCDVLQIAVMYNETDVLMASTNFFLENAKDILMTLKWQSFSAENHALGNELFLKYVQKFSK